jgi:hypothetical protein
VDEEVLDDWLSPDPRIGLNPSFAEGARINHLVQQYLFVKLQENGSSRVRCQLILENSSERASTLWGSLRSD